jgi:hypothetical protein
MNKAGGSDSKNTFYCSFCGNSRQEVRKLISGPIRGATTGDGAVTGGAGGFSNSQSHSPAEPNPFRTDFMPRAFFAPLNSFACVMR